MRSQKYLNDDHGYFVSQSQELPSKNDSIIVEIRGLTMQSLMGFSIALSLIIFLVFNCVLLVFIIKKMTLIEKSYKEGFSKIDERIKDLIIATKKINRSEEKTNKSEEKDI